MSQILPLSALLLGVALLLLGNGLLGTLLAVRGGIEGFDSQTLGAIGAMYFVGFLAGTYLGPRMIRRVGHVRAFAFFTAAIACAALLHELLANAWVWGLLRLVTGMAMVGLYTTVESWLNSHAAPAQRSRIFATYMAVNLGSLALAQQLLHWGDPGGHVLFALAALSFSAAVMPVAATRLAQPVVEEVQGIGLATLYQRAPVACAAGLLSGFAQGAFWGLAPVWADTSQLGHAGVAWFMSIAIVGGAAFQWPIGVLTNRLDRGHVISVIALIAALCAGGLLLAAEHGLSLVLAAAFAYGGFAFAMYPLAVARLMDRLEKPEIIAGSGSLLLLHGIGASLGPLLAGTLMHHFGPPALPLWFIAIQCLLAVTAWWLAARAPADIAQQTPLTPMERTTPGVIEMLETETGAPTR
ncbi:MFS transporter [Azonexus caeni]|jgi:MFS family permease|uniref:MFS transporter n=1 Tax=Azonexus caeni TaxID=266126 RepID=UPI003A881104